LTISSKADQASQQGVGGNAKVRLLNLNVPAAAAAVKKTAAKLIELGVDGLNFAQYALKYPGGSVDAQTLDRLAADIRHENAGKFYNGAENFIFISELPVEKANRSINFYPRSLARFPNTASVCTGSADFVDCLKESANSGVNQVKRNASSLPLWQIGDVTHARADTLFGNVGESSAQISSLSTAIQLFLPGAVKIYYGEELGLPSAEKSIGPQFGQMQWTETESGFSDLTDGKHFFTSLPEKQAKELNFKTQNEATHSHLKVFKKLADLRARDEVFTDGEYNNSKVDGLNVFVRTLEGNDKAFLLVANWPTAGDKSQRKFTVNEIVKPFNLKVGSAEFLIDHPLNEKNKWHIELDSLVTVDPYEFSLVRVQVLP